LKDFAGLSTCTVTQRQKVALGVGWELIRWHMEGMYGAVEEGVDANGKQTIRVSDMKNIDWFTDMVCLGHGCP